ncbi:MAG: hypothetical protein E7550_05390 [Ruminococcaceae bacterium]|nr:hypothetical protein [Oscillospiraceae bacterium]
MAGKDFLEEQRRRQRALVAARSFRQNPEAQSAPVAEKVEKKPLTFAEKFQNFWYYYKYVMLIIVFLAVVLGVSIAQCATREKYDTEVILYTRASYTEKQINAIEAELEKYCEDIDGDGVVNVQVIDCSYHKNTGFEHSNAKESKLNANITSNDVAILYITDNETYKLLTDRYKSHNVEFFVDIGLPDDGGKSVKFGEEFYEKINGATEAGLVMDLPEGLRISRRIAGEETMIGSADSQVKLAERTLKKIAEANN